LCAAVVLALAAGAAQAETVRKYNVYAADGVRAEKVTVAGELEGNVESAAQINVLATGAVIGDVKAGAVTVASGARMRGQVNFGWDDSKPTKSKNGFGSEATN
jgi:cytoskeletal protein CcmA (bactofilin family)